MEYEVAAVANVSQIVVAKCLMQEARGGGRRGGGGRGGPGGGSGRGNALIDEGRDEPFRRARPRLEFEADVTGVEKASSSGRGG